MVNKILFTRSESNNLKLVTSRQPRLQSGVSPLSFPGPPFVFAISLRWLNETPARNTRLPTCIALSSSPRIYLFERIDPFHAARSPKNLLSSSSFHVDSFSSPLLWLFVSRVSSTTNSTAANVSQTNSFHEQKKLRKDATLEHHLALTDGNKLLDSLDPSV